MWKICSLAVYISSVPLISNEEEKKLDEAFPISPILIVDNLGRFFNSNDPEYPEKLYRPISIDTNSSQFNIPNDREES